MPHLEVMGDIFEFRRISRKEIRELDVKFSNDVDGFEDAVCAICVSPPQDFPGWDNCLAGIPSTLCREILRESGFTDDSEEFQQRAIDWAESSEGRLDTLIAFCFPSVSLEDMENMDPEVYCKYAAGTRLIVQVIYKMDPSEFLNPDYVPPPPPPKKQSKSYAPGH